MQTAPLTTGRTGTVLAAALLGLLFIYVTGFMPVEAVHNAAHDTRHAITAPCH
jgi:cobalt transporter subunit CbtB